MFVVNENPRFTRDVDVMVPIDGGHEKQTVKVTYQAISTEAFDAYDFTTAQGSTDFLRKVVVSLDDLVDLEKKPIPYSDNVRDQVLRMSWARNPIVKGYLQAVNKSAEGN